MYNLNSGTDQSEDREPTRGVTARVTATYPRGNGDNSNGCMREPIKRTWFQSNVDARFFAALVVFDLKALCTPSLENVEIVALFYNAYIKNLL